MTHIKKSKYTGR